MTMCVLWLIAADWEEMCIVAVSDKVARAMGTPAFQQLLSALDLLPPSEQVRMLMISHTHPILISHTHQIHNN